MNSVRYDQLVHAEMIQPHISTMYFPTVVRFTFCKSSPFRIDSDRGEIKAGAVSEVDTGTLLQNR